MEELLESADTQSLQVLEVPISLRYPLQTHFQIIKTGIVTI
jgi:hypothetical protein